MSPAICPHCGYDLIRDEPIDVGRFRFDWAHGLAFDGAHIRLTPQCNALVHSLLKAGGLPLSLTALADRIGIEDSADPEGHISVLVCKARAALREAGAPNCIHNLHGRGYFWEAEQMEAAA